MELYFSHKFYIYSCKILNPNVIKNIFITDNENQHFFNFNIHLKITNIETITGNKLIYEPTYKLNNDYFNITSLFFMKKINLFYYILTENINFKYKKDQENIENENYKDTYFQINKNIIKLFDNGYSGEHKIYNDNGKLLCEFYHMNGNIEGNYIEYNIDSNKDKDILRNIQFVNNKKLGYYKTYRNNILYKEYKYVNDILEQSIKYFYNGHINEITNYKFGKKNGKYKYYDYFIKIFINYTDGKKNGIYQKYYLNKLIIECYYIDDKINGVYKTYQLPYNCNNKYYLLHEIEYTNGKRNGNHYTYDKNKNIKEIIIFKDNVPIEKYIKSSKNEFKKLFFKHIKNEKKYIIHDIDNNIVQIIDYNKKKYYI